MILFDGFFHENTLWVAAGVAASGQRASSPRRRIRVTVTVLAVVVGHRSPISAPVDVRSGWKDDANYFKRGGQLNLC
jgi:hypothetical protein